MQLKTSRASHTGKTEDESTVKTYTFSNWIESSGGPFVIIEKKFAPLWGGTNGYPSDFDLACRTSNYIEEISTTYTTALILGDEPLRTLVAYSNDHNLIVRWRWATSEEDVLSKIQNICFPKKYEDRIDVNFCTDNLEIFDSASTYAEAKSINLKANAGKNTIKTFNYSPDPETSLLIHKISNATQKLKLVNTQL